MVFHRETGSSWPPFQAWPTLDRGFQLIRTGIFPSYSPSGDRLVCNSGLAGILHNAILIMNAPYTTTCDRWVGSAVDTVSQSNVRDETARILITLSPKEEKVIRLRFGIGCEREHTLEEIGQEFDVTRERIRQIEAKALRQLRRPEQARRLRALLAAR